MGNVHQADLNQKQRDIAKRHGEKAERYHDKWVFDDFVELVDFVANNDPEVWDGSSPGNDRLMPEWSGSEDFAEAVQFAREGWDVGLEHFEDMLEAVAPYVMAAVGTRSADLAPAGYLPHVPSYCAGSPANMWAPGESLNQRSPVLRMLVSCSALGDVSGQSRIRRGAAICAIIDYFEQRGVSVEIEAVMCAKSGSALHEAYVPVKQAGEPLDIGRVAFALANPAFHRRFGFKLRQYNRDFYSQIGSGMGRSSDVEPDADQIYLKAVLHDYGFDSDEEALKTVLEQVINQIPDHMKAHVGDDWRDFLGADSRVTF